MKAKLIKYKQEMFTNYILKNEDGNTIACSKYPFATETEYLAKSKGITLQRLSHENCDEIFGIIDVEKLADEFVNDLQVASETVNRAVKLGYEEGFKKAMELNKDKQFTEQNLREAYSRGILGGDSVVDRYINALQPTEIEVEIEMVKTPVKMPGIMVFTKAPKLDSEGCLILKK